MGKVASKLSTKTSLKMTTRSDAKRAKRSFESKKIDGKLRFALLASLRAAILREVLLDNLLVTLPAMVKHRLTCKKADSKYETENRKSDYNCFTSSFKRDRFVDFFVKTLIFWSKLNSN